MIKCENSNPVSIIDSDHDLFYGNHDEERKLMIKNKLKCLVLKRQKLAQISSILSFDNKTNLESAFDIQIQLLQGELDKIEAQKSGIFSKSLIP